MQKYIVKCKDNPSLIGLVFEPTKFDSSEGLYYGKIDSKPGHEYWFMPVELVAYEK